MESSPYARVFEDEGRTPMLWNRDHQVSEDLSMSLFNGFDTVLNERDEKIGTYVGTWPWWCLGCLVVFSLTFFL